MSWDDYEYTSWAEVETTTTLEKGKEPNIKSHSRGRSGGVSYEDKEIAGMMAGRISEGHTIGHATYYSEINKYGGSKKKEDDDGFEFLELAVKIGKSLIKP